MIGLHLLFSIRGTKVDLSMELFLQNRTTVSVVEVGFYETHTFYLVQHLTEQ